jgi:hypothetical protein
MKERSIRCYGHEVRAILDGRQTQIRRVVNMYSKAVVDDFCQDDMGRPIMADPYIDFRRNPNGQIGDQLWVRETWAQVARSLPLTDEDLPMQLDDRILVYRADDDWDGARPFLCADGCVRWARPDRWKPSIHMPRWASRIDLRIMDVRVHRLQVISAEDAMAEGVYQVSNDDGTPAFKWAIGEQEFDAPQEAFQDLWQSFNGADSWASNPWVWAISFERVKP